MSMPYQNILPLIGCNLMAFSLALVVSFVFKAFRALDDLIRYEYENLGDQCDKDGHPYGMFWNPSPHSANRFRVISDLIYAKNRLDC